MLEFKTIRETRNVLHIMLPDGVMMSVDTTQALFDMGLRHVASFESVLIADRQEVVLEKIGSSTPDYMQHKMEVETTE